MFWPSLSNIVLGLVPLSHLERLGIGGKRTRLLLLLVAVAAVLVSGYVGYQALTKYLNDSAIPTEFSIPPGSEVVAPGTQLWANVTTVGRQVTNVTLWEACRNLSAAADDPTPAWLGETPVPVRVQSSAVPGSDALQRLTISNDAMASPLLPDARYRLVLEGRRLELKLPWPEWIPWRQEYTFQTLLSAMPVALQPSYTQSAGETITVNWSMPISRAEVQVTPAAEVEWTIDQDDNRVMRLSLKDYEQGTTYEVTLSNAEGVNGVKSPVSRSFTVVTPPGVYVAGMEPAHGEFGLDPDQIVTITFDEPIKDRSLAERAITIDPAVSGYFEWSEDNQTVQFVPEEGFPWHTEVLVQIERGLNVRGVGGGFLEEPAEWTFVTRPNKIIDVDLSEQVVSAVEGGEVVNSSLAGTGVFGAETPTGTFMVLSKHPYLRMRGTTPSGYSYDIPDVPWVMPFCGDYTIHGAYWRSRWGVPQSNGCVSLPMGFASWLYNWAPEGTRIVIHY